MPRSLTNVLAALEGENEADRKTNTSKKDDFYFNAPQPPVMPEKLPRLIRLLTSKVPAAYKPAVACGVFPSLGAHLYQTTFKYTDGLSRSRLGQR